VAVVVPAEVYNVPQVRKETELERVMRCSAWKMDSPALV
jgi:hypothetical protein